MMEDKILNFNDDSHVDREALFQMVSKTRNKIRSPSKIWECLT